MDGKTKIRAAYLLIAGYWNKAIQDSSDESSSDDEDNEYILLQANMLINSQQSVPKIKMYVEETVPSFNERQFQQHFRVSICAFDYLISAIGRFFEEPAFRPTKPVVNQVLAVIWLLATPESYRSVAERFDMTKSTLSKCFVRVINAINQISKDVIKWPSGERLTETKNKFRNMNNAFRNTVGIIDGTYCKMKAPKSQVRSYTNRKCYTSVTLQAICDSEKRFIDCYAGWPSSVPDIRIFKNSDIYLDCIQDQSSYFQNGEYILADKAYPCLPWCIPPFMRRGVLSPQELNFNNIHASIRVKVENGFALYFGRFRRLRDLDMNRIDWIPATIIACCVLHNVCIDKNDGELNQYENEGLEFLINRDGEFDNSAISHEGQQTQNRTDGFIIREQIMNNL